jgi:hypothetical protein
VLLEAFLTTNTIAIPVKPMRVAADDSEPAEGYLIAVEVRWRWGDAHVRVAGATVRFRGGWRCGKTVPDNERQVRACSEGAKGKDSSLGAGALALRCEQRCG